MTRLRLLLASLGLGFVAIAGTGARALYEGHRELTPCGPVVEAQCPDPLCFCHGAHTHVGGWGAH